MAVDKKPRRGKYQEWIEPEGVLKLQGWAMDGLTDEQIAKNMGIAYSTMRVWRDKYPAISAALKKGKEVVDREVENALYRKAVGTKEIVARAVKIKETLYNEEGRKAKETEKVIFVDEEVFVPPETTAQIFWLKNRKPNEWRDRRDVEHSGGLNNTNTVKYEELTAEELEAKIAKLEADLL